MFGALLKRLAIVTVPAIFIAAAWLFLPQIAILPPARSEILPYIPWAVLGLGVYLSVHFHRSRPFLGFLVLAVFFACSSTYLRNGVSGPNERLLFLLLAILVPMNLALFCFMTERGFLSTGGRLRIIFLVVQAAVAAWMVQTSYHGLDRFLSRKWISAPLLDSLYIPQAHIFILAAIFILVAIRVLKRQSHIESGLFGAMASVVIACILKATPDVSIAFVTAAAFVLNLSLLRDTYNMAFQDDLTGLPSRRALNEQLSGLGRRFTIAMVDVDHFKRVNDTHGHDVGDQVLKMIASKIKEVKGGGKVFRYGGEEFALVFPKKNGTETLPHLEELRENIAQYKLWIRNPGRPKNLKKAENVRAGKEGDFALSVTVSIGVTERDNGQSPAEVIREADKALYRAKSRGRNQVCR